MKIKTIIAFAALFFIVQFSSAHASLMKPSGIFFVGKMTVKGDKITLTSQSGNKGVFSKSDIQKTVTGTDGITSIELKSGSAVVIGGKKLLVGKDLPNPATVKRTGLACGCQISCGAGTCCAVAGFKMACKDGVCQYTMERC